MANNKNNSSGGIGIAGVLTLIFITLKLIPDNHGHIIDWSWWWVFSPLWISALAIITIVALVFAVLGIYKLIANR